MIRNILAAMVIGQMGVAAFMPDQFATLWRPVIKSLSSAQPVQTCAVPDVDAAYITKLLKQREAK